MSVHRILRVVWAAPNTLVGLVFLPLFRRRRIARGVILAEGAEWPGKLGWRYSAITFGHVVLSVEDPIPEGTLDHELAHVSQYELWGPLYGPLYGLLSLMQIARGRHFYRDNPFEVQARSRAGR